MSPADAGRPELAAAWQAWLEREVGDARTTLADLCLEEERVTGVAAPELEAPLRAFATGHGLALAAAFPRPAAAVVAAARAPLRVAPRADAGWGSEALAGERLRTYDERDGFVRVATVRDEYLGWMRPEHLVLGGERGDRRFVGLRGHLYRGPSVSEPRLQELAYGCEVAHVGDAAGGSQGGAEGAEWERVALPDGAEGYVRRRLLVDAGAPAPDPTAANVTAFALRLLGAPYVWGGVTAWGLDCSGLVQASFRAHGVALPRDADQQRAAGNEVTIDEMRAGDLLLFPGHVALALDDRRFVHANGHAMAVSVDALRADDYSVRLMGRLTALVRPAGLRG